MYPRDPEIMNGTHNPCGAQTKLQTNVVLHVLLREGLSVKGNNDVEVFPDKLWTQEEEEEMRAQGGGGGITR